MAKKPSPITPDADDLLGDTPKPLKKAKKPAQPDEDTVISVEDDGAVSKKSMKALPPAKVSAAPTKKAGPAKTADEDNDLAPVVKADNRKLQASPEAPEGREGTIRAFILNAFKKPVIADKGVQAVVDAGFTAPRSEDFKADPVRFVKKHIPVYITRGWLVEV